MNQSLTPRSCFHSVKFTVPRELVDAADNWLGFKRLELTVYTDDAPAIRLYEKFGFEREGIRRSFAFKGGTYVDALSMDRVLF
ncbi:hypothetical protein ILFOPFJJ_00869 [Ensifer psoraleae]|nr:hypothetical protein [Sinorhizobium psoraleae]